METFKKQYRDLEMRVLANLRYKISVSKEYSKYVTTKCLKVNVSGYTELAIINDQLTFLDSQGLQYSWANCSLEDLIDILNKAEEVQ